MRRPAMNILLLVIFCLWCHLQPSAGEDRKQNDLLKENQKNVPCHGFYAQLCGSVKRSDIDDLVQAVDLGGDGERPDRQEARGGEGRGYGGRESGGFRGAREGDDLRSEFSDLRQQLSEERSNSGNRGHSTRTAPLDPALDRLRSLLRKTAPDVADREDKDEKQEEEPPRRGSTDTNRRYIAKDTLTMMRRILDDIERRLDSKPVSDSVSKKRGYADDTENKH